MEISRGLAGLVVLLGPNRDGTSHVHFLGEVQNGWYSF